MLKKDIWGIITGNCELDKHMAVMRMDMLLDGNITGSRFFTLTVWCWCDKRQAKLQRLPEVPE